MGLLLVLFLSSSYADAQKAKAAHSTMAPLEQYLISDRNAEIALARSAAPESVSANAEILALTLRGFETVVKGTNGFVCMVARSWSAEYDDPDFWNPGVHAPICYNALAARSQVAATIKRTETVLAGGSKAQVREAVKSAIERGELPTAEAGAMAYMLSRQQYLSESDGAWRPHLMFFMPDTDPKRWGAGRGSLPIMGIEQPDEHLTVFLVPVGRWSDGTADHASRP